VLLQFVGKEEQGCGERNKVLAEQTRDSQRYSGATTRIPAGEMRSPERGLARKRLNTGVTT
jgi:hypothetical protein